MPSQQRVQLLLRVKIAYLGNEHGLEWHPIQAKFERGMKAEHCDRLRHLWMEVQAGSQAELLRHRERSRDGPKLIDRGAWRLSTHLVSSGLAVVLRSLNQSIQQLVLLNFPFPDISVHL